MLPVQQNRGRLLITGAAGFLGTQLVSSAHAAGWDVIAHVREQRSDLNLPDAVARVALDLDAQPEWQSWIDGLAPTAVIHAAALSRIAACERDPALARRINVDAPRALTLACAQRGARMVLVSTDLVFGRDPAPGTGFCEHHEPAPISLYGISKLEAESAVLEADPAALVVRLPLLVGPSAGRGLGASDSVWAAQQRGERPALFDDEWRTPLDVRSAAEALLELARLQLRGILHLAGPERISRYDLGLRALRQHGLRADRARAAILQTTREASGLGASRPADVSLDATRARGLLSTLLVGLDSGSS